jgi:hypothetical protein
LIDTACLGTKTSYEQVEQDLPADFLSVVDEVEEVDEDEED